MTQNLFECSVEILKYLKVLFQKIQFIIKTEQSQSFLNSYMSPAVNVQQNLYITLITSQHYKYYDFFGQKTKKSLIPSLYKAASV